jgi:hypothetical protein
VKLAKARCKALNTHLFNRARFSGDVGFLASPPIGGISLPALVWPLCIREPASIAG